MYLLSLALVLASAVSSRAASYSTNTFVPFTLERPELANRPDIGKLLPNLKINLKLASAHLQTIDLPEIQLHMFSPLAENLQRLAKDPSFSAPQRSSAASTTCAAHRRRPPVSPICPAWRKSWDAAFTADFENSCVWVAEPEKFVRSHPPGEATLWQMTSLESVIAAPGEALSHIKLPTQMVPPERRHLWPTILRKVRSEQLLDDLVPQQTAYRHLQAVVASSRECAVNPQERIQIQKWLQDLQAENQWAQDLIQTELRTGLEQAARDREAIRQTGRERELLPYPSLTDEERKNISYYLGALYWRMRGGGLIDGPEGTQKTRFYFTFLAMSVLGYVNGGTEGRSAAQGLYYRLFKGWGRYMDMGHTANEQDKWHDLVHMTQRGLYQVTGVADTLTDAGFNAEPMIVGGLHMGPCYYFAWEKLAHLRVAEQAEAPYETFIDGPTAWGELCTGAALGMGLSESLLGGYRR